MIKLGHEVRLIPPFRVEPFVKRGKIDAAEAIRTAVQQPTMRFVPVKTAVQQAVPTQHRTRDFLVRQPTQLANPIRAHLCEFGLVVPKGVHSKEDRKTSRRGLLKNGSKRENPMTETLYVDQSVPRRSPQLSD